MVTALLLVLLAHQDRAAWNFDADTAGWRNVTYSGQASFSTSQNGLTGPCLTIEARNSGADASWSFDAPVSPGATYRLSGWIRTEGVKATSGVGALLNVHQVAGAQTKAMTGDSGWTRVETVFRTGERTSVQVNCLFGGWGQATGSAYYDDLALEKVDMSNYPGLVTIDVSKKREPISKYIYGQFIEHLGRCIYGGIWAEMLEDRKFYYPIEGKPAYQKMREGYDRLVASPWRTGDAKGARLVTDTYRSQPVLELKGMLEQSGLAIEKGKKYKLRVTLKGTIDAVDFINSHLRPGTFARSIATKDWKTVEIELDCRESYTDGSLYLSCKEPTRIAAVSLMPADNIDGFRRDTIEKLKELNAPIYRWPGGNFVSGYEWRDGIGERDKRPTIPNPAWTGIDTNDVGIHEFMRFCELVGAEPLVVVNTGFGDPFSAGQEVEYCNGAPATEMGTLRAANGREKPFNVRWWGIGNEMYGSWQLGHIPIAQYVTKHNQTADRMRAVDPTINLIAVGDLGEWDENMLTKCADRMTLLSEHIYVQERADTVEHTRLLPEAVRRKADWHRKFQPTLKRSPIKVSMDEWNYWYGPYLYGELGTRYYWKDGMGVAAGLHEFFRNTDVFEMAQYAQTVNVIGAIKTSPTAAELETTGVVLAMYRAHFGTVPVSVDGIDPDLGLDIVAALTADGKEITIAVVNPFDHEVTVPIHLAPLPHAGMNRAREGEGAGGWGSILANRPTPALPSSAARTSAQEGRGWLSLGTCWTAQNDDPRAYNEPGAPRRIDAKESVWKDTGKIVVPKFSVTIVRVALQ